MPVANSEVVPLLSNSELAGVVANMAAELPENRFPYAMMRVEVPGEIALVAAAWKNVLPVMFAPVVLLPNAILVDAPWKNDPVMLSAWIAPGAPKLVLSPKSIQKPGPLSPSSNCVLMMLNPSTPSGLAKIASATPSPRGGSKIEFCSTQPMP